MDWLFEHFQIVIFILVGVIYALRALTQHRERNGDDDTASPVATPDESAEAERTRKIQEEIRRRILARQRGETPPSSPGRMSETQTGQRTFPRPSPAEPERPAPTAPPSVPKMHRTAPAPARPPIEESILERQRKLQEKLAEARAARAATARPAIGSPGEVSRSWRRDVRLASTNRRAYELRRQLTGTSSIRRAMLLREILGPPLGMQ